MYVLRIFEFGVDNTGDFKITSEREHGQRVGHFLSRYVCGKHENTIRKNNNPDKIE